MLIVVSCRVVGTRKYDSTKQEHWVHIPICDIAKHADVMGFCVSFGRLRVEAGAHRSIQADAHMGPHRRELLI